MWIGVVTLLPELFASFSANGVARRAFEATNAAAPESRSKAALDLQFFNPREFTERKHGQVDDKPYGGGPGMVMQAQPVEAALAAAKAACGRALTEGASASAQPTKLIVPTPQGLPLTQSLVQDLAAQTALVFLCGRYEGIDERVLSHLRSDSAYELLEVSLGDFVLTGGELVVQVILDALSRWLPGTLGNTDSAALDSFADGLLEGPHFTRPDTLPDGRSVPEVLLSGDHTRIDRYRRQQALARTLERRPELLLRTPLTALDRALLAELFAAGRLPGRKADS